MIMKYFKLFNVDMNMKLSLGKNWKLTILRLILIGWGIINVPLGVYTGSGMANPETSTSFTQ